MRHLPSGMFSIMAAGGLAGISCWALAMPMDVVKARLQMPDAGGQVYNGILDCMRSVRKEGVRVFFCCQRLPKLRDADEAFPFTMTGG